MDEKTAKALQLVAQQQVAQSVTEISVTLEEVCQRLMRIECALADLIGPVSEPRKASK